MSQACTRPLAFFGGKGGVGKTTLSAAAALVASRQGHRTLLVSTDPAHSLSDVLRCELGDRPTEVGPRLWAVEIDAEAAAGRHVAEVYERMSATVDADLLPALRHHLELAKTAPGTLDAAAFEAISTWMEACPDRFDRVVFDTAPTGHTLRLLAMPALLSAWVEGLARRKEKVTGMDRMYRNMAGLDQPDADPVLAALHDRRARFERAAARLRSDAAIWLVLIPERLPIEETVRAEAALERQGLEIAGLVVNRRLPDGADGAFLAARLEQQRAYEEEIGRRLGHQRTLTVPQRPRDVAGPDDLAAIAEHLPPDLLG